MYQRLPASFLFSYVTHLELIQQKWKVQWLSTTQSSLRYSWSLGQKERISATAASPKFGKKRMLLTEDKRVVAICFFLPSPGNPVPAHLSPTLGDPLQRRVVAPRKGLDHQVIDISTLPLTCRCRQERCTVSSTTSHILPCLEVERTNQFELKAD